ncbi:hypothetical protein ENSA5_49650 [Enhygromyxa salina]|uniref:VWFA domain-containing protein n=1 Tax=Enhygromyxa salina TaxID=215803 RepID=A0A2S9XHQ2_9BACT|nr:VWA domain-containing protein [Enhygromyxa salina]PRP92395.1 hypothetical protein ENSA5_49650 [Enhygromyxa salina]
MRSLSQTSRSLAAAFVLALAASGCSFADSATLEQAGDAAGGEHDSGDGDGDGDGDGSNDESDGGDTGEADTGEPGTGDEDPGPSFDDPELDLDLCDPNAEQTIAYDLTEAKVEASPALVRESVLFGAGVVPPIPLSARPFLNHYDFDYAPAQGWEPELSGELWASPVVNIDAPQRYRLQYAVRGPEMSGGERLPVDLAIVVDLGASMSGEPVLLAEEALAALESALIPGDRVTLIAAADTPILLGTTKIEAQGTTPLTGRVEQHDQASQADVAAALTLAYDTLTPVWEGQGQQRVVLISNGHFASGDALASIVEDHAIDRRYLICVGVGDPMQFDDALIRGLAHEGRGSMLFARDAEQLWLELDKEFTANMIAAATELEVTLTLPPGLAVRERDPHLGMDSSEPRLAMLAPNDALVFHHQLEACSELSEDAIIEVTIEWTDALANEAKQAVWQLPVTELGEGSLRGHKGAATMAYARVLRSFRDGVDPAENYGAVLDAISYISDALELMPEDPDLLEMSSVVAQLSK